MPSSSDSPRAPYPWEQAEERLVVETPEQAVVEYRIAPLGSRFIAAFTDLLLLLVVALVLALTFLFAVPRLGVTAALLADPLQQSTRERQVHGIEGERQRQDPDRDENAPPPPDRRRGRAHRRTRGERPTIRS